MNNQPLKTHELMNFELINSISNHCLCTCEK
jgi:hypothetical protein